MLHRLEQEIAISLSAISRLLHRPGAVQWLQLGTAERWTQRPGPSGRGSVQACIRGRVSLPAAHAGDPALGDVALAFKVSASAIEVLGSLTNPLHACGGTLAAPSVSGRCVACATAQSLARVAVCELWTTNTVSRANRVETVTAGDEVRGPPYLILLLFHDAGQLLNIRVDIL